MEHEEFREILGWRMASDPFPIGVSQVVIDRWIEHECKRRGFQNWIDAYHADGEAK